MRSAIATLQTPTGQAADEVDDLYLCKGDTITHDAINQVLLFFPRIVAGTLAAVFVLVALANCINQHTGRCFPSMTKLARDTNLHRITVVRKIAELVAAGLIRKRAIIMVNGNTGTEYEIVVGHAGTRRDSNDARGGSGAQQGVADGYTSGEGVVADDYRGSSRALQGVVADGYTNLKVNQNRTKKTPHSPPQRGAGEPQGFDEFWQAYPRRQGANPRKPAMLAYERSLKRGTLPSELLDAAKALTKEWQGRPGELQFVPQATTWLNQDRYRDTLTPHVEGKRTWSMHDPADRIEIFRRTGMWYPHWGPQPDLQGE
jgi:hypothetical protein